MPTAPICLRDVLQTDLPVFFAHQCEPEAVYMAAFTAKDPANRVTFDAFWSKILADPTVYIQTILYQGKVSGSVLKYEDEGHPEVSYWLGQTYWGKGIATEALTQFLRLVAQRPIYARAAKDNLASIRVLEKCGFVFESESVGFANARSCDIPEICMVLS